MSMFALDAPELLRLPFDQYGRYRMMREAIDAVRPLLGTRLRILDVGGFYRDRRGIARLPAQLFLPYHDVTVLDREVIELPGYIRGDGRGLAFADQSFDLVISCDTLEHVPAADRAAFWGELLRVARYGVLLAAPFASAETVAAEALLRAFIQSEMGIEQPQLAEHVAFGLPELSATAAILMKLGMSYRSYPAGYVHAWLAMMIAKHSRAPGLASLEVQEQLDAYYTRFFGPHERCAPSYRYLVLVERPGAPPWLEAADAALLPSIRSTPPALPDWPNLLGWVLHIAQQPVVPSVPNAAVEALQNALAQRDAQIADLERRAAWYAEQARAAQAELAAVQQGRALRVLNWLAHRRKRP